MAIGSRRPIRILAISGSLRENSSNRASLEASAVLAPKYVTVDLFEGLSRLPHFNPDCDVEPAPVAVQDFRERLKACDGILISSPEYAHGVPGSLKNGLDWVVSSGETVQKPFALIKLSSASIHAPAQLKEILTVMMAREVPRASVTLPLHARKLNAAEVTADPETAGTLRCSISALVAFIEERRVNAS
jgi:NAD(P)H-dependent FMN reductase